MAFPDFNQRLLIGSLRLEARWGESFQGFYFFYGVYCYEGFEVLGQGLRPGFSFQCSYVWAASYYLATLWGAWVCLLIQLKSVKLPSHET